MVQDVGGAGFKTGGILKYVEDFKPGTNTQIGPEDFSEIGFKLVGQYGYSVGLTADTLHKFLPLLYVKPARLDVLRVLHFDGVHDGFIQAEFGLLNDRTLFIDLLGELHSGVK